MKIIQTEMRFRAVELDKQTAQMLLDKNHPNNRKQKPSRIVNYRRDMDAGLWDLTWEAVVQDEDGFLVEGQNRLSAFLQSSLDVLPVVLCTGAPRKSILGAGNALARSVVDVARIAGDPFPHGEAAFSSVARRMALGINNQERSLSHKSLLAFVDKHRRALEYAFADTNFGGKQVRGITQAPVRAVIARSFYKRGCRERVSQFCQVMLSGLPDNPRKDVAAIRLRNWLLDNVGGVKRREGFRPSQSMVYAKAERALQAFIAEEFLDTLYATKEELFPIPDDPQLEMAEAV